MRPRKFSPLESPSLSSFQHLHARSFRIRNQGRSAQSVGDSQMERSRRQSRPCSSVHCKPPSPFKTSSKLRNYRTIVFFAVWATRYLPSLRSNRLADVAMLLSFEALHILTSTLITEGWGSAYRIFAWMRNKRERKTTEPRPVNLTGYSSSRSLYGYRRAVSASTRSTQRVYGNEEGEAFDWELGPVSLNSERYWVT